MNLVELFNLHGLDQSELKTALIELCERGLLTCTASAPGLPDATYAVAWLPLNNPENFSQAVRDQHAANMQKFSDGD